MYIRFTCTQPCTVEIDLESPTAVYAYNATRASYAGNFYCTRPPSPLFIPLDFIFPTDFLLSCKHRQPYSMDD